MPLEYSPFFPQGLFEKILCSLHENSSRMNILFRTEQIFVSGVYNGQVVPQSDMIWKDREKDEENDRMIWTSRLMNRQGLMLHKIKYLQNRRLAGVGRCNWWLQEDSYLWLLKEDHHVIMIRISVSSMSITILVLGVVMQQHIRVKMMIIVKINGYSCCILFMEKRKNEEISSDQKISQSPKSSQCCLRVWYDPDTFYTSFVQYNLRCFSLDMRWSIIYNSLLLMLMMIQLSGHRVRNPLKFFPFIFWRNNTWRDMELRSCPIIIKERIRRWVGCEEMKSSLKIERGEKWCVEE